MSLVDRAQRILLSPKTEWAKIDAEPATPGSLFTSYAMILALLPAIGALLNGILVVGALGVPGLGIGFIVITAIVSYVISLGVLYLMGIIAAALAPSFDGRKDTTAAMKVLVYSATATWVAGFFSFIPVLSILIALAGFGYAAYLIYLGCQTVLKVPEGKAVGFTAVTILIWIGIYFVVSMIVTAVIIGTMFSGAMMGAAAVYR